MIDDMGNQIYPGSIDNGAIDVEYSPTIERKICAQDERFASVNEAIGLLQYQMEQHIEKCADGLAPLAGFITSSWAVINELEARIAKLEKTPVMTVSQWPQLQTATPFAAAAHPPEGDWAHIPAAEWEAICKELEALRAFKAGVPLNPLADVIDHYRAGLEIKYVEPRLYLAMNWLIDNSDWIPALPYRHTRKKGDGLYTINAPKEAAE